MRLLIVIVVAGSALLGVLVWIVVGRALRPVDEMRRTVSAISDRDLHRRVEAPGTGDELDRLADTLNELLERLDVAVNRERQFVADASHELRTPIAGVRALLETEPVDPAAVLDVRADALARVGQLEDLVDELLVLARADDGERDAPTRPVDLDELVLSQARQLARTTNLRVDTSNVSGGQVAGRDTDLARVVENLATNAARHASTTVAFSVQQVDGIVELTVVDDGPGIPSDDRTKIFERFRTFDDARTAGDARTGLGLSIASAIVDAHHGTIQVDDGAGRGRRLVVRLPRADGTAATLLLDDANTCAERSFSDARCTSRRATCSHCPMTESRDNDDRRMLDRSHADRLPHRRGRSRRGVATTVAQAEPSGSRSVADSRGRDWPVYGHDYSNTRDERARAHDQPRDGRPAHEGLVDRRIGRRLGHADR